MKTKRVKSISLFLAVSVLTLSVQLTAKEKKGADLIVQKRDGTQIRGELIAVKENSLLLLERETGADVTVDISDISAATHVKKSKLIQGAAYGLLIGGASGAGIAAIFVDWDDNFLEGLPVIFWGIISAVIGSFFGGSIGAGAGTDEKMNFSGRSDAQIEEILEKLRKKARIKNAP
jgi:hypothetical protein